MTLFQVTIGIGFILAVVVVLLIVLWILSTTRKLQKSGRKWVKGGDKNGKGRKEDENFKSSGQYKSISNNDGQDIQGDIQHAITRIDIRSDVGTERKRKKLRFRRRK